jgi:hypothetical protein
MHLFMPCVTKDIRIKFLQDGAAHIDPLSMRSRMVRARADLRKSASWKIYTANDAIGGSVGQDFDAWGDGHWPQAATLMSLHRLRAAAH